MKESAMLLKYGIIDSVIQNSRSSITDQLLKSGE